jgi:hypothetical protein
MTYVVTVTHSDVKGKVRIIVHPEDTRRAGEIVHRAFELLDNDLKKKRNLKKKK